MKFRSFVILLAVMTMIVSCREIIGEQHENTQKKNTPPATKIKKDRISIPKDSTPKSKESKPVKKSRAQDSLKPMVASA